MTRQVVTIPQGVTWGLSWPITESGQPLDISTWTVRSQVRSTDRASVLHEWSTILGNATTAGNAVTLLLTPAASSAWLWDVGVYDVELTDPDGNVYQIADGVMYVSAEVTR